MIEIDARGLLARLRDPDALAMIAHEMVHVVQRYPHAAGWLVEGIADYMRYYVLIPDDPGRAFRPDGATWHDGYQASAGFLDWVEQGHPGTITRVNATLRAGEEGPARRPVQPLDKLGRLVHCGVVFRVLVEPSPASKFITAL